MYCADQGFFGGIIAPMALLSALVMILIITLTYLAAKILQKADYEGFVSIEIHQLWMSLAIFVAILGSSCLTAQLSETFAGGDPFDIARNYLGFVTNSIAMPATLKLQGMLLFSQYMGSWTMRWGAGAWGTVINAFPAFILWERVIDFLLLLISPFTASLMVQQSILEIIRATTLPFILPAGVVLRFFPPTRDASAFLLAAALGFGIIFPFTYVIHSNIVPKMYEETMKQGDRCGPVWNTNTKFYQAITEFGFFSMCWLVGDVLVKLSYLLLQALFLPALSITLTITFIKGVSKFISQKLN